MLSLYLLRHGEAEGGMGRPDYMRGLTAHGLKQADAQGVHLAAAAVRPTRILHSPYKRAVQTADLVNEHLNLPMDSCEALVPDGSVSAVLDVVAGLEDHLLLVCHLPIIADIAHCLTRVDTAFYPATLAHIQRADAFVRKGVLLGMHHAP